MTSNYRNIRLSTTEAGLPLGYLIQAHQIPERSISIAVYNDHSQKFSNTDGGQGLHGFSSVQINFNNLDSRQAQRLRQLVDDALALSAKRLWATIDLGWNGSATPGSWVDVYGRPLVPDISPSPNSRGVLTNTVTLTINNVVIDNNPATGI